MIKFYNTIERKKVDFNPLVNGKISLYTCGPTVYDFAHIGNFRAYIFEDLLRRTLEFCDYEVFHVMNLTDIDDKTINKANIESIPLKEFTDKYIQAFHEDVYRLNIIPAHHYPRATEFIDGMIGMIQTLEKKGYTYTTDDGSVFFKISNYKDYGKLANLQLEDLVLGERVENDEYEKEEMRDFALWKSHKKEEGDIFWESPWGKGRPGWHIECSVMSTDYLGDHFDIHCGGVDNIFPHHENEIAQSEVLTGKTFARYWVHTAFLRIGGNRMGKSEQNFIFVRDALKDHSAEAIRHFLVSAHYRSPLDYNATSLSDSDSAIRRLNNCLERIGPYSELADSEVSTSDSEITRAAAEMLTNFELAMDEDFNTALAMGEIYKLVGHVNRFLTQEKLIQVDRVALGIAYQSLIKVCMVLGIYSELESIPNGNTQLVDQLMELVIDIRNDSRLRKDWVMADKVRDRLHEVGIELRDTPSGTNWEWRGD